MRNDPAGAATVSLGRVLIDASPDKVLDFIEFRILLIIDFENSHFFFCVVSLDCSESLGREKRASHVLPMFFNTNGKVLKTLRSAHAICLLIQVYAKLAHARKWEGWLGVAQLVHTAQLEQLQPGNTFSYTSNLAPGFIDAVVEDAEPGKVIALHVRLNALCSCACSLLLVLAQTYFCTGQFSKAAESKNVLSRHICLDSCC